MLQQSKLQQLFDLVNTSTRDELVWMNGYISGLIREPATTVPTPVAKPTAAKKISLVFGTETGNSRRLAGQLAAVAKKKGVHAKLVGLDQYKPEDLHKEDYFFVVISTQGGGEPPLPAKKFYDHIIGQRLELPNLKYSVLALGDTSYPEYCKTGIEVDERLNEFGGTRIVPLQKCDVDYEEDANAWFERVIQTIGKEENTQPVLPTTPPPVLAKKSGKKYYEGKISANINLNDRGSNKQTYHIELTTEEAIEYEPGDTIGIVPRNRLDVVDRILQLTGMSEDEIVTGSKTTAPVRELLTQHVNICYLLSSTMNKYAAISGQEIPDIRMDLVDLLRIYPLKDLDQFRELLKTLLPIAPRLYSVCSSPAAHGDREVHITVARDRFLAQDEQRYGLCSEFLGDQPNGSTITFYVHKDKHFKLPAADKDVIMIGPGTGVAPFRSFLFERDATGATGRNWFFFGEQHFTTDFLYQSEMQQFAQTGVLSRIDLAFSRDQDHKIYVQHRMEAQRKEFYSWISKGASLYISGTKDPMSKDVEAHIVRIFQEEGNQSAEAAAAQLEQLRKEGRYAKDVY